MAQINADFDIDTPVDHNFHQDSNDRIRRWEESLSPAYWEYRHKWENNPVQRVTGEFPIHLDIEATSACNLRCIMCPRTEMIEAGTFWKVEMFDFDAYCRLIDEGVRHGLCSVKFNYAGEPTLNPRLVEMVTYAKKAGVIDVMFNTNATRLDADLSRRLIESGLDKLFFSFDSADREQFNAIRVGADFDQTLANIKQFMAIRAELNSLTPFTRVSMVLMKGNQHQVEPFKNLFAPIVDAVAFVDYLEHTNQSNRGETLVPIGSRKTRFCCPQLWQRMFVHPDGVATVCCMDAARELRVGNIFEQSIQEIWLGDAYRHLRELHTAGRFDEIPACARCALARY